MIEVFGIAFSIMGLLPSIASTLSYSIPAGPVGMVWVSDPTALRIFIKGLRHTERKIGLVPGFGIHLCCGTGHGNQHEPCLPISMMLKQSSGRSWLGYAYIWRTLLVDALLLIACNEKPIEFPGRLQQHIGTYSRTMFD